MNPLLYALPLVLPVIAFGATRETDMSRLRSAIEKVHQCAPEEDSSGGIRFCTGLKLNKAEIEKLIKMSRSACTQEIQRLGFRVVDNAVGIEQISAVERESFERVTVHAKTFFGTSIVALKAHASSLDCVHELFHILQWKPRVAGPLSPATRDSELRKMQGALEKEIEKIESLEKAGKVSLAAKAAQSLQSSIETLNAYGKLADTLDETEAYYFLYRHCDVLGCGEEDRDMILANLNAYPQFLPKKLQSELSAKVAQRIKAKRHSSAVDAAKEWKSSSLEAKQGIGPLLDKTWDELVRYLRSKGVRLVSITAPVESVKRAFGRAAIPDEVFASLDKPNAAESAAAEGKLTKGAAIGKYLCDSAQPTILLTSAVTKGTLIHEYFHHLQRLENPIFCDALTKQSELASQFAAGKILRTKFEAEVFRYQAINALAEREVYEFLLQYKDKTPSIETANNEEMLLKYKQMLE